MAKDRSKKWSRIASAILVPLILSGIAIAAMQGHSNVRNGAILTGPAGQAVLQGDFPATYHQGQMVTTRFNLTNGVGSTIVAHLELTLSRPNISSSDATLTLAGNPPVLITCDSSNCTFVGSDWTIYVGTTSAYDIGLQFNVQGEFNWSVVAIWS